MIPARFGLIRHGVAAFAATLLAAAPTFALAQVTDLGADLSEAAPAALHCPGRALPDQSAHFWIDQTWVTFNTADANLEAPSGVALDADCNVYVLDNGGSNIVKLDQDGNRLLTLDSGDQFTAGTGISVDRQGNLFLADPGLARVVKLDSSGQTQLTWAASCAGVSGTCVDIPGTTLRTGAIAADGAGRLYIPTDNVLLQVSTDGPVLGRWGATTPGGPRFGAPSAVTVDAAGNVLVADASIGRVQKISPAGHLLSTVATQATRPGQSAAPFKGIAIDRTGNMFLALSELAVDGQGNRFLSDPARGRVVAAVTVAVPSDAATSDD